MPQRRRWGPRSLDESFNLETVEQFVVTVPQAVDDLMHRYHFSLEEIAEALGVTASAVTRWHSGTTAPRETDVRLALLTFYQTCHILDQGSVSNELIYYWFIMYNGAVNDTRPIDLLRSEPQKVIRTARAYLNELQQARIRYRQRVRRSTTS